jgi:[ribosomal protein S5]-alanine N-acetyltransferase
MQLQTERLKLQELFLTDLDAIHELHSLPKIDQYNTLGIPDSINTTEILLVGWLEQQKAVPRMSYIFCIRSVDTNQFVGLMALNLGKPNFKIAEVWYKIHPSYWRQGYTTEALTVLLKFGFSELGLHRIEAGCAVENIASIKVLEKVGMTREGRKRKVLPIRGEWIDNYFYAILETEFGKIE